jgi:hypothetical protein
MEVGAAARIVIGLRTQRILRPGVIREQRLARLRQHLRRTGPALARHDADTGQADAIGTGGDFIECSVRGLRDETRQRTQQRRRRVLHGEVAEHEHRTRCIGKAPGDRAVRLFDLGVRHPIEHGGIGLDAGRLAPRHCGHRHAGDDRAPICEQETFLAYRPSCAM